MEHIRGLVAPVHTPMHADGSLDLDRAAAIVEHLGHWGVIGLFVCGSTGEGLSLSAAGSSMRPGAVCILPAPAGPVKPMSRPNRRRFHLDRSIGSV